MSREVADLRAVEPVAWNDIGDGADAVLRPNRTTITRLGSPALAFRVLFATLLGRRHTLNRTIIDPIYRPILWLFQQGVPMGVSANDLERLSELGRRWIEAAGIRSGDTLASILPPGKDLDYWQLVAATRRAGVPAAFLSPQPSVEALARLRPAVLAGRPGDLLAAVEQAQPHTSALANLHTVLATGELIDDSDAPRSPGPSVPMSRCWRRGRPSACAPCGRSAGDGKGFHTWPAAEDRSTWWTRVRSSRCLPARRARSSGRRWDGPAPSCFGCAPASALSSRRRPCPSCGRTTPRVVPVATVATVRAEYSTGIPASPRGRAN